MSEPSPEPAPLAQRYSRLLRVLSLLAVASSLFVGSLAGTNTGRLACYELVWHYSGESGQAWALEGMRKEGVVALPTLFRLQDEASGLMRKMTVFDSIGNICLAAGPDRLLGFVKSNDPARQTVGVLALNRFLSEVQENLDPRSIKVVQAQARRLISELKARYPQLQTKRARIAVLDTLTEEPLEHLPFIIGALQSTERKVSEKAANTLANGVAGRRFSDTPVAWAMVLRKNPKLLPTLINKLVALKQQTIALDPDDYQRILEEIAGTDKAIFERELRRSHGAYRAVVSEVLQGVEKGS